MGGQKPKPSKAYSFVPVGGEMNIDKNDLIAVAVSKAEQQLHERRKEHEKALKDLKSQLVDLDDEINELVRQEVNKHFKKVDELKNVLKVVAPGSMVETGGLVTTQSNEIHARLTVRQKGSASRAVIRLDQLKVPKKIRDLIKKTKVIREEACQETRAISEVARHLDEIPALERRARAKFAEHVLSTSAEGRVFLDAVDLNDLPLLTE